ncbi:hypothetical protein [Vagococcus fessus]|uniref:Uncharacterized protein n=1 Tax=Vagococcus fessus TaxID=120370 RepID=A0A430ACH9_9ENTE|nr:hypothetical protein [Vagococcus fessus]RSU04913.1 hypothetical protein CBF31_02510 [Vagococcus fessus]
MTEKNKVFYSPIGDSRDNPLDKNNRKNTLGMPVDVKSMLEEISKDCTEKSKKNKEVFEELLKKEVTKVPVWGFSDKKFNSGDDTKITKGDIVVCGYLNCSLYVGRVYDVLDEPALTYFLWNERETWNYKVLFDQLLKVYIPGNHKVFTSHPELREASRDYELVEKELIKENGFRKIFGIPKSKKGSDDYNLQGTRLISNITAEQVNENLTDFILKTRYQCIVGSFVMEEND